MHSIDPCEDLIGLLDIVVSLIKSKYCKVILVPMLELTALSYVNIEAVNIYIL
jgi:hypothetical protein